MTTQWIDRPFWSIARRVERTGFPDAQLLSVYREWGVVRKDDREDNFNRASDDLSTYKLVEPGNLVINKMKTWQGSLGVSAFQGIVSPAYFVCQLSADIDPRFAHHLLRSQPYIAKYGAASKGIRPNQWDLPYDELRQVPVRLPPLDEQRWIAEFLDDRVARIDRIIASRRRQVSLVETALWGECDDALRGLTRAPVRRLVKEIVVGIVIQPSRLYTNDEDGVPALRGLNVRAGFISTEDLVKITPNGHAENRRSALRSGDVVVVRTGDAGVAAVVPRQAHGWNCIDILVARPSATLSAEFLEISINAARQSADVAAASSGSIQQHFGVEALAGLLVPTASASVQAGIVLRVQQARASTTSAQQALRHSIELLSEYKQSLITAAVTGELDVTTAGSGIPG